MASGGREETVKVICAILESAAGGLDICQFRKEYRDRIGFDFPIKASKMSVKRRVSPALLDSHR